MARFFVLQGVTQDTASTKDSRWREKHGETESEGARRG